MTFGVDLGLTGDGLTGFIDTGLAPSAAVHFTLNKGMYGAAISNTGAPGAYALMGTSGFTVGACYIFPNNAGTSFTAIGDFQSSGSAGAPAVHGIYMETRPNAGNMRYFIDATAIFNDPTAPAGLDTLTFLVGSCRDALALPAFFSPNTSAGFWIGDGQANDADQAVLEGILNTYLTAIGAL